MRPPKTDYIFEISIKRYIDYDYEERNRYLQVITEAKYI